MPVALPILVVTQNILIDFQDASNEGHYSSGLSYQICFPTYKMGLVILVPSPSEEFCESQDQGYASILRTIKHCKEVRLRCPLCRRWTYISYPHHFPPQPLMRPLATQSLRASLSGCPTIASRMPPTPSTMTWAVALSRPVQGSRIMGSGVGMLWSTAVASPEQRSGRSSAMGTHYPPR